MTTGAAETERLRENKKALCNIGENLEHTNCWERSFSKPPQAEWEPGWFQEEQIPPSQKNKSSTRSFKW